MRRWGTTYTTAAPCVTGMDDVHVVAVGIEQQPLRNAPEHVPARRVEATAADQVQIGSDLVGDLGDRVGAGSTDRCADGDVRNDTDRVDLGSPAIAENARWSSIGDEVEFLHRAGHRDVEQAGTSRRDLRGGALAQDLVRVDHDDPVELETLDPLGIEQRQLVGAEFVHVIDRSETVPGQRRDDRLVQPPPARPRR